MSIARLERGVIKVLKDLHLLCPCGFYRHAGPCGPEEVHHFYRHAAANGHDEMLALMGERRGC